MEKLSHNRRTSKTRIRAEEPKFKVKHMRYMMYNDMTNLPFNYPKILYPDSDHRHIPNRTRTSKSVSFIKPKKTLKVDFEMNGANLSLRIQTKKRSSFQNDEENDDLATYKNRKNKAKIFLGKMRKIFLVFC
jgi:hypothetical protein